jgi:hypothetical protein
MSESSVAKRLVFISHAGEDAWVAGQIAREVDGQGAQAFFDRTGIRAGDEFQERLRDALDRADELVALLTPWSLTNQWVLAEMGVAWHRRIRLVAALHGLTRDQVLYRRDAPPYLRERHLITLNENDMSRYLAELKARVEAGRVNG